MKEKIKPENTQIIRILRWVSDKSCENSSTSDSKEKMFVGIDVFSLQTKVTVKLSSLGLIRF